MLRLVIVLVVVLNFGCAFAAQDAAVLEGLRNHYAAGDVVAFRVANRTKQKLFYWVRLEMRDDDGWYLVYSSLAGLRDEMSEPEIMEVQPGETVAVQWIPVQGETFRIRDQRGSHDYRLVLETVRDLREETPVVTPSATFRVD
jgi:hypothetical protein